MKSYQKRIHIVKKLILTTPEKPMPKAYWWDQSQQVDRKILCDKTTDISTDSGKFWYAQSRVVEYFSFLAHDAVHTGM
jgi:hypothetical protein